MHIYEELLAELESGKATERQVHAILKKNRDFVTGLFADSWNFADSFSEVQFGSDFRADFLVLCANSGYWIAHVVELKSPSENLYNNQDQKSRSLQLVEKQLLQREDWRRQNEARFRDVLANLVPEDAAAQCSYASVHCLAKSELRDPKTVVHLESHAVIGRSSSLSREEVERRRLDDQSRSWGSPKVLTYDRVLRKAKRLFEAGEK